MERIKFKDEDKDQGIPPTCFSRLERSCEQSGPTNLTPAKQKNEINHAIKIRLAHTIKKCIPFL
jgi:hypothetical protein